MNHALVRLSGQSRATLTDSEGRFQFDDLSSGFVTLQAEKPGFLHADFGGSRPASMLSFRLAHDSPPVVLKLTPESIISGQVSDEGGEPLEGFVVDIFLHNLNDKNPIPQPQPVLTDDEGKFHIAGLHPGSYILAVRQTQAPVQSSPRKSLAPMGYSPVFYPDAKDASSAVPLKLLAGKTVQADFSLKREPYVQLSGSVSGYRPHEHVFLTMQDSWGASETSSVAFDPATGSFHTKWIPPGVYTLTAQSGRTLKTAVDPVVFKKLEEESESAVISPPGASRSFASLRVNATSSRSGLHLAMQTTLDVPVVVRGLPLPPAISDDLQTLAPAFALIPKENGLRSDRAVPAESRENVRSEDDLHLFFAGVVPGTYELVMQSPSGSSLYAESATWGSTDLLHSDLVLDSSGSIAPIEVVVRDDGATLNGAVSAGDTPVPAQVVLLSEGRKRPQLVSVGNNGRFEISGLAPGAYRVFAVDSSSADDYSDPAFLQKISSKIQEVTLSPKQSASVDLEIAAGEE